MKRLIIFGLVLMAIASTSQAQEIPSVEILLDQLQSELPDERTKASQQIYGAGIENADLYAAVADAIENGRGTLNKNSPGELQQEIAWHAKVLGGSGHMEYMQLLDELSQSPAKTVSKYARASKKMLTQTSKAGLPYVEYQRVQVITDIQAERCEFVVQQECSTYRSLDKCLDSHKDRATRVGANAIMILHDSGQVGFFKSGMMANYYKCRDGVSTVSGPVPTDSGQKTSEERSYIDELRELAQLRDEGIISEEEFQAQKTKILEQH